MEWIAPRTWAGSEQLELLRAVWRAPRVKTVLQALEKVGVEPLLVGGVVRDLLLGRENKDIDLIVCCSPRRLLRLQRRLAHLTGCTAVPLDPVRGTVRLCFPDGEAIDLVALQGETLEHDLLNRDLTINALAVNSAAELADPTGGRHDLVAGIVRQVAEEAFEADPLRVVRAVRFVAQLDFQIEPATLASACRAAPGLAKVAGERISAELEAFFGSAESGHFDLLYRLGLPRQLHRPEPRFPPALLEQAAGRSPLGFKLGLALLFGPLPEKERREALFERLKLSRRNRRYLERWWDGAAWLGAARELDEAGIYRFSRRTREAFGDLARVAVLPSFPTRLSDHDRRRLVREASGQGALRWEPLPWDGRRLSQAVNRPPGRWMGELFEKLEEAWALRQVTTEAEITRLAQALSTRL